jgi:SAM-dependent methyltransferase
MAEVDWDLRAKQGVGLQSVIDPADRTGLKNGLIDRIQWNQIKNWAGSRRTVLDFGCGIGRFAQRFEELGVAYWGVDTSASMVDSAKQLHLGRAAKFLHAAQLPLPLTEGSFDGCLTVGVLQCLKTADTALLRRTIAELARVLVTGGELLIIEQASASGRHSGSVSESTSEQDYVNALRDHFEVSDLRRIRCGGFSRLSALYLRAGRRLPLRHTVEGLLAARETTIARNADPAFLQSLVYYDVAIRAVKRAAG